MTRENTAAAAPRRTPPPPQPAPLLRAATSDDSTVEESRYAVALAPSATSREWLSDEIAFTELVNRAEHPADRKACGLFLLGRLRGRRRARAEVVARSGVALDYDHPPAGAWERTLANLGALGIVHTTFSSTPAAPRFRVLVPLDREVTPDEYPRAVRALAARIGTDGLDRGSSEPERAMYWPAAHPDRRDAYRYAVVNGPVAVADDLLAEAPEEAPSTPELPSQGADRPATPAEARYMERAVPRVLADLADLAALPDGARDERGRGWEEGGGLFHLAARLVELSNLAPGAYPIERAEADYLATAPRGEERRFSAKFADALASVGDRAAEIPDAVDDFDELGDGTASARSGVEGQRHLVVQRASEIRLRRVLWLWEGRMAMGALSLLAGREGLGKSSLVMWLVAMVTRGTLPGNLFGSPRAVIIAATEDSWEHTLVPRLIAAGADLDLVLRVDVMTSRGFTVDLSLPDDIPAVKDLVEREGVALMVLDPLMSRLHGLDTHKDSEVRIALEPLVRMADETRLSLIGLIHLNKNSTDPLNAVMGSKAFTAVARSVSTVVPDDSDEEDRRRLFGTVKNNLGPALPASQVYTIETAEVPTEDGPMPVGKLVWHGEVDTTIKAAMADAGMDSRTAVQEAQLWLSDFLADGASISRKDVVAAARKVDLSESAIKRAASKIGVVSTSSGFPRTTFWSLPDPFEADAPEEDR